MLDTPFIYVDTPSGWEACLSELKQHKTVCIDLESNSLYVYKEEICLIQISVGDIDYIIDPKTDINLAGLGLIIQDPTIEKVFHACEYDLILLKKQFDWEVSNLFDTMWAARILGVEKIGLANIIRDVFGVELDKKFQKADWGKRPLSPEMLAYAQNDTHYLHRLRDHFAIKLKALGHWEEAQESFVLQSRVNLPNTDFNPDNFWNFHGIKYLEPQNQAICKALFAFRETEASKYNRPLFKIFDNKRLLQLAEYPPATMDELFRTRGLPGWYIRKRGPNLLQAIRAGSQAPIPERPKRDPKPAQDILDRYDAMLNWRKETARARGVESDIILSKDSCWQIAKGNPQSGVELADYRQVAGPWRIKTYEKGILAILAGYR
ncbi:MAG: ribonuclease D [Cellvibrionaceae bacterium]|jgi:ribonuclease D